MDICLALSLLCTTPRPACNYNQPEQTELANCDPSKIPYRGYKTEKQRYNYPRLCEKYDMNKKYRTRFANYNRNFLDTTASQAEKNQFTKLNCR